MQSCQITCQRSRPIHPPHKSFFSEQTDSKTGLIITSNKTTRVTVFLNFKFPHQKFRIFSTKFLRFFQLNLGYKERRWRVGTTNMYRLGCLLRRLLLLLLWLCLDHVLLQYLLLSGSMCSLLATNCRKMGNQRLQLLNN